MTWQASDEPFEQPSKPIDYRRDEPFEEPPDEPSQMNWSGWLANFTSESRRLKWH